MLRMNLARIYKTLTRLWDVLVVVTHFDTSTEGDDAVEASD